MPNCSKCNAVQSRLNKGALCKKCFNNKINTTDKLNTCNDDPIEIDPINDDRSIVDFIKSQMTKELELNNEINQVLRDQIIYLKSEITHKNDIIKSLITRNHCNAEHVETNYVDKRDESTISNDNPVVNNKNNVTISPDNSINDNDVYVSYEDDDIPYNSTNDRHFNNKSKRRTNCYINSHDHNANNIEHANRYKALFTQDNENVDTIHDIADEQNINPSQNNNITAQSKRPHIVTQDYPENNFIKQRIRPGDNDYNEAVKYGKTTVVFSTSITKGINVRQFNDRYKMGTARFRRFHGAKSKYMKHYVLPTLVDEKPQVVLLQCGGNDLPTSRKNPTPVVDIANHIIDTAKICENYGADSVLISSIITRKQGYMERRRTELNRVLKEMCYDYGFIYVDNDNIKYEHLYDEVHLNHDGSDILGTNFLHALNNVF